jgi:acetolactate synthase-1/2/3 large subunit
MEQLHGGRIVARALKAEGVSHVFTLCGGHVMSIYDGCLDVGIRVVDTRHEQTAAHAADGWARVTGKPGVAVVTAGPGLTDAVTGVASAWRANIPMIIFGGQGPRSLADKGSLQDMNHVDLMRPITKWSHAVPEARRLAEYVSMAFRIATTGVPGPVFLEVPVDFLFANVDEAQVEFPTGYRTEATIAGDPEYVERACALLRAAERPVALVGSQLFWSKRREAYRPFVEHFGLPVYVNGQGRGSLPPAHPLYFHRTRKDALRAADVILIFGTPLDFRLGYGRDTHLNPDAKVIQVDLDGAEIGRNRHIDVGIVGDTGVVMGQLADAAADLERGGGAAVKRWVRELRAKEDARWEQMRAEVESDATPINPLRLCKEIDDVLDDDTIVIGDGGDFVATAASVLRIAKIGQWLDPGPLGTLGVGPGYAMAAKLARPGSNVVIVYGDGAFGLNGLEFEALARQKINVVGVIGNDAAWMQIRRGQVEFYGHERAVATALDYTRYDQVVEALGGHGEWVERPADIRPALERALGAGKPALVNVKLGASEFRKGAMSI